MINDSDRDGRFVSLPDELTNSEGSRARFDAGFAAAIASMDQASFPHREPKVADVDAYCSPTGNEASYTAALNAIIIAINRGTLKLPELVNSLGDYLTVRSDDVRKRATLLLAEVLIRLPTLPLTAGHLTYLAGFFCDRMRDSACAVEVLRGCGALLANHTLARPEAVRIARGLWTDVNVQSFPFATRKAAYEAYLTLLTKYKDDVASLGDDFVFGFIQSMDGEKDPRNLVLSFQCVLRMAGAMNVESFSTELFEITSCYFPITFKSPPNAAQPLDVDGLVRTLRDVLACTPSFAPHTFAFLIEKIGSTLAATKVESMVTLSHCARIFGAEYTGEFNEPIWQCLRDDVLLATDTDVIRAALSTLQTVASVLSSHDGFLAQFLRAALTDCRHHLGETSETKLARSAAAILAAFSAASDKACRNVLGAAVPHLVNMSRAAERVEAREGILAVLVQIVVGSAELTTRGKDHPMAEHAASIFTMMRAALSDTATTAPARVTALRGLGVLGGIGVLDEQQQQYVWTVLVDRVLYDSEEAVWQTAADAVVSNATSDAAAVVTLCATPLMDTLSGRDAPATLAKAASASDAQPPVSAAEQRSRVLSTLSRLATTARAQWTSTAQPEPELCARIVLALGERLLAVLGRDETDAQAVITALAQCLSTPSPAGSLPSAITFLHTLLEALSTSPHRNGIRAGSVAPLASLAAGIARGMAAMPHGELVDRCVAELLRPGVLQQEEGLTAALSAVVCTARPAALQGDSIPRLLDAVLAYDGRIRSLLDIVGSVANKIPEGHATELHLDVMLETHLLPVARDATRDSPAPSIISSLIIMICKGRITRGHSIYRVRCTQLLVELLSAPAVRADIAAGFGTIMAADDDVFSARSFANVKMLYRQRFFSETMPLLLSGIKSATDRAPFYIAVANLVRHVPQQVLVGELPTVFPLMLESLGSPLLSVRASTATTISSLVKDAPDLIATHLQTVIPQVLSVVSQPDASARLAALNCLTALSTLPYIKIFPHKDSVTAGVVQALDDSRRIVRQAAVKCRNIWMLMGDPKK